VHNVRRRLDRLTIILTITLALTFVTFDLIFISGRGIAMIPYAKLGDFSFSRFGFIVRTESQYHRGG